MAQIVKVDIVSPYPLDSTRGNTISALRIASLLEETGLEVSTSVVSEYQPQDSLKADQPLLIALHARKSHPAIEKYLARHPKGNLILLLTGSDIHFDLSQEGSHRDLCLANMERANKIILCQKGSLKEIEKLPKDLQIKTEVIGKSVAPEFFAAARQDRPSITSPLRIAIFAHLRKVKRPDLAVEALLLLSQEIDLHIDHYGEAPQENETNWKQWAKSEDANNPRWTWKGSVPRLMLPKLFQHYHLSLNTSDIEGGANAIAESAAAALPVLASNIDANIGMLGSSYPGYFEAGNAQSLADTLLELHQNRENLLSLQRQIHLIGKDFLPEKEKQSWVNLINSI